MIDTESFMSLSDVATALGSASVDVPSLISTAKASNDHKVAKETAIQVLSRNKVLTSLREELMKEPKTMADVLSVRVLPIATYNAVIASFVLRDMNKSANVDELKTFFTTVTQSGCYNVSRFRDDVRAFVQEKHEDFSQILTCNVMREPLSIADILPAYMQMQDALSFIPKDDRERFLCDLDDNDISTYVQDALDIFYDCINRDALSGFLKTKDEDAALGVYVTGIQEMQGYAEIDAAKYVEMSAENLAKFEGVIV